MPNDLRYDLSIQKNILDLFHIPDDVIIDMHAIHANLCIL